MTTYTHHYIYDAQNMTKSTDYNYCHACRGSFPKFVVDVLRLGEIQGFTQSLDDLSQVKWWERQPGLFVFRSIESHLLRIIFLHREYISHVSQFAIIYRLGVKLHPGFHVGRRTRVIQVMKVAKSGLPGKTILINYPHPKILHVHLWTY